MISVKLSMMYRQSPYQKPAPHYTLHESNSNISLDPGIQINLYFQIQLNIDLDAAVLRRFPILPVHDSRLPYRSNTLTSRSGRRSLGL